MPEYGRARPRSASERVYRALLRAYPRDLRDEFGDAMMEFHRDRLFHARRNGTPLGVARVWARALADLARNALPARIDSVRRRLRRHTDERDALRETASLTHFQREDLMLTSILQDIRYALRAMRRSPGFTGVALLLAGIGIFGVISYSVNQRRFEIGLRLALGATPKRVVRQVVGEGVRTAAIGAVIGIGAALGATRLLMTMFVDVKPTDPITLGSVTALVVLVALAASFVPARRASAVDPLATIRDE